MTSDDSDELLEAVVVCEGNIQDPKFISQFPGIVKRLKCIICKGQSGLKVRKVEPWNSVRVTMMIPPEAAMQLRRLAQQGSSSLRELGILSVQLEGDQVISLTLASDKREVSTRSDSSVANAIGNVPSTSRSSVGSAAEVGPPARPAPQPSPSPSTSASLPTVVQIQQRPVVQAPPTPTTSVALPTPPTAAKPTTSAFDVFKAEEFRSPNVVVPQSSKLGPFSVPQPPSSVRTVTASCSPRPNASPFPFASMEHAAHSISAARTQENCVKTENVACGSDKTFPQPPSKPTGMSQIQVTYRPPATMSTMSGSKIQSSLFTVAGVTDSSRIPPVSCAVSSASTSGLLVGRTDFSSAPSNVPVQAPAAMSSPLLVNLLQTPEPPLKSEELLPSMSDAKRMKQQPSPRVRRFVKDKPGMMRAAASSNQMVRPNAVTTQVVRTEMMASHMASQMVRVEAPSNHQMMRVESPMIRTEVGTNPMVRLEAPGGSKVRPEMQGVLVRNVGPQHFEASRSAATSVQQMRKAGIPMRMQGSPYISGIAVSPAPGKSYIVAGSHSTMAKGVSRPDMQQRPAFPGGMKPNVMRLTAVPRGESNVKLIGPSVMGPSTMPHASYAVRHSVGQMVCVGGPSNATMAPPGTTTKQPTKCDVRTGTLGVPGGAYISGGVLVREFPPNRPPPPYPGPPAESKGSPSTSSPSMTTPPSSTMPVKINPSPVRKSPSPPELTSTGKRRQYLINPLTGLLEPLPTDSESSDEDMGSDSGDKGFPMDDDDEEDEEDDDSDERISDTESNDAFKEIVEEPEPVSIRGRGGTQRRVGGASTRGRGDQSRTTSRRERRPNQPPTPMPPSGADANPAGEKLKLRLKLGRGGATSVAAGPSRGGHTAPSNLPSASIMSRPVYKVDYVKTSSVDFGCDPKPISTAPTSLASASFASVSTQSTSTSMARTMPTAGSSSESRAEPRVPPLHISLKKGRPGSAIVLAGKESEKEEPKQHLEAVLMSAPPTSTGGTTCRVYTGQETILCSTPGGGYVRVPASEMNKIRRGKPVRGGRLKHDPSSVPTPMTIRPYSVGVGRGGVQRMNPVISGPNPRAVVMNDAVLVADKPGLGRGRGELQRVKLVGLRQPGHISTVDPSKPSETLAVSVGVGNRLIKDPSDVNPVMSKTVPESSQKWTSVPHHVAASHAAKVSIPNQPVYRTSMTPSTAAMGMSMSNAMPVEAGKQTIPALTATGDGTVIRVEVPAGKAVYNYYSTGGMTHPSNVATTAAMTIASVGPARPGEMVFTRTSVPQVVSRVEVNGPVLVDPHRGLPSSEAVHARLPAGTTATAMTVSAATSTAPTMLPLSTPQSLPPPPSTLVSSMPTSRAPSDNPSSTQRSPTLTVVKSIVAPPVSSVGITVAASPVPFSPSPIPRPPSAPTASVPLQTRVEVNLDQTPSPVVIVESPRVVSAEVAVEPSSNLRVPRDSSPRLPSPVGVDRGIQPSTSPRQGIQSGRRDGSQILMSPRRTPPTPVASLSTSASPPAPSLESTRPPSVSLSPGRSPSASTSVYASNPSPAEAVTSTSTDLNGPPAVAPQLPQPEVHSDEPTPAKHPRVEWLKTESSESPASTPASSNSSTSPAHETEQQPQQAPEVHREPAVRLGGREILGSPCGVNDDSGIESMDTQSDKGEASSESPNRREEPVKTEPPVLKEEKPPNDDENGPGSFDGDMKAARFASTSIVQATKIMQTSQKPDLLGLTVGSPLNLPAGTKMVPVRVVPLAKPTGEATYLELNSDSSQFLKSSQNQVAIMTSPVKFLVSKVASSPSRSTPAATPEVESTSPKPETPTKRVQSKPSPKPAAKSSPVNGSDAVKENCAENGEVPKLSVSVDHNYVHKTEVEEAKIKPTLEQLTIEIPSGPSNPEEDKRMATRSSTRSASRLNSPQSREDACTPSPCSTSSSKSSTTKQNFPAFNTTRGKRVNTRGRNISGDSNASLNSTSSLDDNKKIVGKRNWSPSKEDCASPRPEQVVRPGKRRCSENAAELIKACMGVDEHPVAKKACLSLPLDDGKKGVKEDENLAKKVGRKAKVDADVKVVQKPPATPNRVSKRIIEEKNQQPVLKTISRSGRVSRPRTPDDEALRSANRNNHTPEGMVKRSIRPIRGAGAQNRKAGAGLLADTNCGGNGSGLSISGQDMAAEGGNDSKNPSANTRKRKGRPSGGEVKQPPPQVTTKRRRAAKDGAK